MRFVRVVCSLRGVAKYCSGRRSSAQKTAYSDGAVAVIKELVIRTEWSAQHL